MLHVDVISEEEVVVRIGPRWLLVALGLVFAIPSAVSSWRALAEGPAALVVVGGPFFVIGLRLLHAGLRRFTFERRGLGLVIRDHQPFRSRTFPFANCADAKIEIVPTRRRRGGRFHHVLTFHDGVRARATGFSFDEDTARRFFAALLGQRK